MYTYRKATEADLPTIHHMQDVPFRDHVYANVLPDEAEFCQVGAHRMQSGEETFYMLEHDGAPEGFVHYIRPPGGHTDIIVWGRWIKTLMYAAMKVAFDQLGCDRVFAAVRQDNKRVIKIYRDYNIRKIGQEMTMYRPRGIFAGLTTAGFNYYEMTLEEFREKEEELRRQSVEIVFA